jgi:hypothetical protein
MEDVSDASRPPLTAEEKAQMRQWLENWRVAGPLLEEERWERLRTMTEDEAQLATRRVLELWQPDWPGDNGEGLLLLQRVVARARRTR